MLVDDSLINQLLIAMPGMLDPNFSTTVTLICEHNDEGALGIVINRPTTLKLSGLFEQLSVEDPDPEAASRCSGISKDRVGLIAVQFKGAQALGLPCAAGVPWSRVVYRENRDARNGKVLDAICPRYGSVLVEDSN